jgi:hypothetical protein
MPSPFPGMDPYLERPSLWPDVHHGLIGEIQASLNSALRPRYVARVEMRVYISDEDDPGRQVMVPDVRVESSPKRKARRTSKSASALQVAEPILIPLLLDDQIEEAFLEIRQPDSGVLVTVIEVMSPTNKIMGSCGRNCFMVKRREVMSSNVHWVEIDLLRAGERSLPSPPLKPSDYRITISRNDDRRRARYWPVDIRQALPIIGIPLKGKDADVPLDLGAVLRSAYDRAAYDETIDYRKPPTPSLDPDDAKWANQLLREKGLRR